MNDIEKKLEALKAEFLEKLEALRKEAEMQKKQKEPKLGEKYFYISQFGRAILDRAYHAAAQAVTITAFSLQLVRHVSLCGKKFPRFFRAMSVGCCVNVSRIALPN